MGCFIIINFIFIHLPKQKLLTIGIGILYTLVGLVLFLTAAQIGYMPVGFKIGESLANISPIWLIIIGFVLGFTIVFLVLSIFASTLGHLVSGYMKYIKIAMHIILYIT